MAMITRSFVVEDHLWTKFGRLVGSHKKSSELNHMIEKFVNSYEKDAEGLNLMMIETELEQLNPKVVELTIRQKYLEEQKESILQRKAEKEKEQLEAEKERLETSKKCICCFSEIIDSSKALKVEKGLVHLHCYNRSVHGDIIKEGGE